ncbi:TetR/AcrR family transcriptional regulator [Novosphingobium sp. KACC 22771]|uniref:TetR/AcrR family transcriptional regulator n=1 Tax=Novosphingobium sp. KACC 22771 TaxID=3025670 RepID=UPI002366B8BA|nr:TetR/AcrR family transcriptional regulator [Novosphingobium sp. KACC 22771]WDF74344.1 TetR/AcrR family transcriptional regulator [Novosphingobium sp. KACC 22771]
MHKNRTVALKQRLSGYQRKALILEAARGVFLRNGFEHGKTSEIAKGAGVSEAMVYRHFSSKAALYRAVLRQTIREQNENHAVLMSTEQGTAGLIATLKRYFEIVVAQREERMISQFRLIMLSLAGDGSYASLVYRRALRMTGRSILEALKQAKEAGDLHGEILDPADTSMFVEHIGTVMSTICALPAAHQPYGSNQDALVLSALRFCCRGLGFTEEAITRHLGTG